MVTKIDRPRVFRHGGLSGDVLCGLVVGIEMVVGSVIPKESHHCTDMFACLITLDRAIYSPAVVAVMISFSVRPRQWKRQPFR